MSLFSKRRKDKAKSPLSDAALEGGNAFFNRSSGALAARSMGKTRVDDLLASAADLAPADDEQVDQEAWEAETASDRAPGPGPGPAEPEGPVLDLTAHDAEEPAMPGNARAMHEALSREFEAADDAPAAERKAEEKAAQAQIAEDPVTEDPVEDEPLTEEAVTQEVTAETPAPDPVPAKSARPEQPDRGAKTAAAKDAPQAPAPSESPEPQGEEDPAAAQASANAARLSDRIRRILKAPQTETFDTPPASDARTRSGTGEGPAADGAAAGGALAVSAATGPSAVSTEVRNTTRAQLDMEAMKKAPDLKSMVRRDVVRGSIIVCLFGLFIFGWSAMAPLSSAAIAPGVISPHGSRKTVQHLEGGIIDRILVEEGSHVMAGETLVLMKDTMAKSSYDLIRNQYYTLAARLSRLTALQTGQDAILFPDWLMQEAGDPEVDAILASERQLLMTSRTAHTDRKAVLQEQIGQLEKEIDGLQAQIDGQDRQLLLIRKEIAGVQELLDKGLERRPRLLALQRNEAQINARKGANVAQIAKTEQAISETELQLIAADAVMQDEVAQEISAVQAKYSEVGERMAASSDILERIEIRAPVSGKVIDLHYHTAGGIIAPGSPILDIVPENEELLIEARVSPMDIDVVYEGLEAQIRLTAFAQRNVPRIEGKVSHVSADRHVDQITGQPYFLATVEIEPEEVAKIGENITLMPGMPAEVMIVTGQQTLAGYLAGPVMTTLRRSFRES